MNSSVAFNSDFIGSALQAWDIAAIDAVYGTGGVVTPSACNPPRINTQPSPTIDVGATAVTFSVTASGDAPLQYRWYVGTRGNTNAAGDQRDVFESHRQTIQVLDAIAATPAAM